MFQISLRLFMFSSCMYPHQVLLKKCKKKNYHDPYLAWSSISGEANLILLACCAYISSIPVVTQKEEMLIPVVVTLACLLPLSC